MENGVCATATAWQVCLVLHKVTLVDRAQHLPRELHNALWHHLTQQLDPSSSYRKKLAQYFLHRHHGRGDEETEEDIVGGSKEEKKREYMSKRPNKNQSRG